MYTHDFEVNVGGIVIQGEIVFNGGKKTSFKTVSGEEMDITKHRKVQELFEFFASFSERCGEIIDIKVSKK